MTPKLTAEELMQALSLELYEEEQLRAKVSRFSKTAQLLLITTIISFVLINIFLPQTLVISAVLVLITGLVFAIAHVNKQNFNKKFKVNIIHKLIQLRYPELSYYPQGSFPLDLLIKANRFNAFRGLNGLNAQDTIEGRIAGAEIKMTEVRNVTGLNRKSMPAQESSIDTGIFKGLVMSVDFFEKDIKKLENIMHSTAVQAQIKALDEFWGSYP